MERPTFSGCLNRGAEYRGIPNQQIIGVALQQIYCEKNKCRLVYDNVDNPALRFTLLFRIGNHAAQYGRGLLRPRRAIPRAFTSNSQFSPPDEDELVSAANVTNGMIDKIKIRYFLVYFLANELAQRRSFDGVRCGALLGVSS